MKKYIKEIIILIIQLLIFYILPLFAGPADTMGLVVLIIFTTFILGIINGCIVKNKTKYFYPLIVSIIFFPSIYIYYNESALIYLLWFLIDSGIGTIIGIVICKIISIIKNNK